MNILHIAAHLGDGAGKAIGGLASKSREILGDTHRILLLDKPNKLNHIEKCRKTGVEILDRKFLDEALSASDIAVVSWWGGKIMDDFLRDFPEIPCRVLLWSHKNGFYDPPLPQSIVDSCDGLLATSPKTLENPLWADSALVYGYGDFEPEPARHKTDYSLTEERFRVGYVGMPSYKRFPKNACEFIIKARERVPNAYFVFAGEYSDEFRNDLIAEELSPYVELLGWTNDVESLLPSFDVFGYLMREDTSATTENSVLEAMAAGLPVIMPREPVGKYILGNGCGLLMSSPDEFAAHIKALYDSETLRKKLGNAARNKVVIECDPTENCIRFQKACVSIISAPKKIHRFGGDHNGCYRTKLRHEKNEP